MTVVMGLETRVDTDVEINAVLLAGSCLESGCPGETLGILVFYIVRVGWPGVFMYVVLVCKVPGGKILHER